MRKLRVCIPAACLVALGLLSACSRQTSTPEESAAGQAGVQNSSANAESVAAGPAAQEPKTVDGATDAQPAAEATAAKLEMADQAGLKQRIAQAKGRVVVVDVWSTSCVPCMKEFPHLVELARRWPEDVVCISLNVDYLGLPSAPPPTVVPKVAAFLNSQTANADNLIHLVSSEPDTDVLAKLDVESMPAILVTDRSGQQVAKLTIDTAGEDGLSYAGDVVPLVEKLIEEK